ncbi:hypothetical protein PA598K_04712 [Paenibacillus sp. 598K]|uniref:MerR family transcriptional regulator n=1 Tax=Paenibacillus sp. 598K TaxID=1117987 RepID=UPI000FFA4028|nr:MerR family transcriptional regulator [Paenibacillus sp. 598K]GBF76257.1 hypothetical protein PA598K_04712 [Paenibacillus sp. 598K]
MKERIYTIKEVAAQTELSTQLIRKWEERYRAVSPKRLPNGYRAYSKDDIETLRWLKRQVDDGVSIAMAVMEKERREAASPRSASFPERLELSPVSAFVGPSALWDEPVSELLAAIEQIDQERARRLIDRFLWQYPAEHVLTHILQPVLVGLGERWERQQISEYQEHFGSHLIRETVQALCAQFRSHADQPLLVTACGPGERHELGILFVGFFARQAGYRVVYLGASPAIKGILDCIDDLQPEAIALSFSSEELLKQAEPFLLELDRRIAAASPHTLAFIGGAVVRQTATLSGSRAIHMIHGDGKRAVHRIQTLLETERISRDA